jgi:hypothetical protein
MTQDQLFELAIVYADSVNTIVILACLLLAKRFGVLQYF